MTGSPEVIDLARKGASRVIAALAVVGGLVPSTVVAEPAETSVAAVEPPSEAVAQMIDWVVGSADNRGKPFLLVDKIGAAAFAFDAEGRFIGRAPVLVGAAVGDDTVAGIGERELSAIKPDQRTTPAGRFVSRIGPAIGRHDRVLWVDYDSSVALHPVILSHPKERRLQRLSSPTAEDNRITYGCINVPADFFKFVVLPLFSDSYGVVYILPETKPLPDVFPAYRGSPPASQVAVSR